MATACREKPESAAPSPEAPEWIPLQGAWEEVEGGAVGETGDTLRLSWGETLTAAKWTGEIPEPPFEIEMEARRLDGTDFFCGLTFPARGPDECLTLIVGGWGGALVGISSIDGQDASGNETKAYHKFENNTWYRVRLRRDGERLEVWIDEEKLIDVPTAGKALSLRPGPIAVCAPFGLATWQSGAEIRAFRWRPLAE